MLGWTRSKKNRLSVVVIGVACLILLAAITAMLFVPSPWIIPVIFVAIPLSWVVVRFLPGWVFAAYVYIPFYKGGIQPYVPIDITIILAVACIGLVLLHMRTLLAHGAARVVVLWTAFLATLILGTTYSVNHEAPAQLAIYIALVYLPCLFAIVVARSSVYRRQFLAATMVLSAVLVLNGIVLLGTLSAFGRLEVAGSTTISTARSALLLPMVIPFLWTRLRGWMKPVVLGLLPAALVVALATGSRGPLVAFLAAAVIVQLIGRKRVVETMILTPTLVVGGLLALQLEVVRQALPPVALARITSLIDAVLGTGELDTSSQARVWLMDLAGEMFATRPISGHGVASFEVFSRQIPGIDHLTYPHNLVVQIAAELGLVGLTVFGILVLVSLRALWFVPRTSQGHLAVLALAAYAMINALFSNSVLDNRWAWAMLIMAASLPLTAPNPCERNPSGAIARDRATSPRPGRRRSGPPQGRRGSSRRFRGRTGLSPGMSGRAPYPVSVRCAEKV